LIHINAAASAAVIGMAPIDHGAAMSSFITASRLEAEQTDKAYPLVRSLLPDVDPAEWQRIARELTESALADERGILTVRNAAGYICGLCFYTVERDAGGARLIADHFVAFDVTERAPFAAALLGAIDSLAAKLGCIAIHTCLAASQKSLFKRFRSAGYAARNVLLCKSLGAPDTDEPSACVSGCLGRWWRAPSAAAAITRSARPL
jgi:hypothetical protein